MEDEQGAERRAAAREFVHEVLQAGVGAGSTLRSTFGGRQQLTLFSLSDEEMKKVKKLAEKYTGHGITVEVRHLSVMCTVIIKEEKDLGY